MSRRRVVGPLLLVAVVTAGAVRRHRRRRSGLAGRRQRPVVERSCLRTRRVDAQRGLPSPAAPAPSTTPRQLPSPIPGPSATPGPGPPAQPSAATRVGDAPAGERSIGSRPPTGCRARASRHLGGRPVWTGTTGYADVKAGRAITADTTFAIASMSKTFTAALILGLVDDGKLRLDTKVATLLPLVRLGTPAQGDPDRDHRPDAARPHERSRRLLLRDRASTRR